MASLKRIEWMCTQCEKKHTKSEKDGRPQPGKCPKKANGGPHSWVKNKEF